MITIEAPFLVEQKPIASIHSQRPGIMNKLCAVADLAVSLPL
jgi:hypothetical protein